MNVFLTSTLFSLDQNDRSGAFLLKVSSADSSNDPCYIYIEIINTDYYN